jgi:translation initiation factor 1
LDKIDWRKELGLDDALAAEAAVIRIRVDSRRYGKKVTVLDGFDVHADLEELARELKRHLGAGGTVKDGAIEVQGEHRKAARAWLEGRGLKVAT